MRNNETDACKICRTLSEDKDKPQCEFGAGVTGGTACLSKDRAMLVLLNKILELTMVD